MRFSEERRGDEGRAIRARLAPPLPKSILKHFARPRHKEGKSRWKSKVKRQKAKEEAGGFIFCLLPFHF
jgi:hypothetical protein